MTAEWMTRAIWGAGMVHAGIVLANIPLPGRLRVRERLATRPWVQRLRETLHPNCSKLQREICP